MLPGQLISRTALLVLFCSLPTVAAAQAASAPDAGLAVRPRRATISGIITDRLSAKDLQRWQAIERIVFAEDAAGYPLHPTLRGLWEWVETSGHAIYLEMVSPSRISTCTAGSFSLTRFDPQGKRHEAVIRLHPANIDQAYVGPNVARPDGLIPFEGLKKEERYAEVLGHELAHAVFILSDLARAKMVEELIEQTNERLLSRDTKRRGEPIGQEMRERLLTRDSFLRELEAQAEAMETAVWRELIASQKARGKSATTAKQ
jgi:hypothetical protein